jgi:multiple sugar transport system substrate-binding protein
MMKRRDVLNGLAALGLVAAGAAATAAPALAQTKTIRMWTFLSATGTTPREVALAQIIKNYEAANPGTKIVVETQVWDQMTPKFLAAHRAGNAPDISWVVTDFLGDAIGSGSLADLNELFIKKWPAEQVKDHASAYWDLTKKGDKQYALFASPNYIAIVYRADLLKAAGIDPASIKTWDDLRAAAEKLTVKNASGQVTRWGFAQGFSEQQADPHMMIPHLLGEGEQLFKPDGKANFASPAGVAAMTFATDLVTKHKVAPPQAATWTVDDLFEQFSSDRVAMIQGPSVRVSTLQAKLGKENVGLMLWPGNGKVAHSPAVMAGWAVGVWSKGQQKEEAGKFVEYMLGGEAEKIWVTVGGQSPLMASTAKAVSSFVDQPGNGYIRVAAEGATKYGWLTPIDFNVGGYRQALNKATQRIIVEGVPVKTALEEAETRFNRQNNR